jgi:hypothetical protein
MKCKYFYDGLCNIGKKCPYPRGTENSCPNFEEDNYLDNPDRERDISDNH